MESYLNPSHVYLIEELYMHYQKNKDSVDPSWRYFFDGMDFSIIQVESPERKGDLILQQYRQWGHLKANTNPLFYRKVNSFLFSAVLPEDESLVLSGGLFEQERVSAKSLIAKLDSIYCGSIGFEYMHCAPEVVHWLQKRIEQERHSLSIAIKERILRYLNQAEYMERYLHTKYVGQKRFSLEGTEVLIPLLAQMIEEVSQRGVEEIVMGMPHRGRLSVLANILRKSYAMIFSEFEDFEDPQWGGDVKYHKGFSSTFVTESGRSMHISLTANPSHLESVDPIVEGQVLAKQRYLQDEKKIKVLPILIHGDASLSGQGVVYETLQLSKVLGYRTGGTIHIVVDNQIGFTASAHEYSSTDYPTDIALAFKAPIFHLNAEDPEECIRAMQIAVELRQLFHCDVLLHLIGYRKYGHNEADEPAFTHPVLYEQIRTHSSIREKYRTYLLNEGSVSYEVADRLESDFQQHLEQMWKGIQQSRKSQQADAFSGVWTGYLPVTHKELNTPVDTTISMAVLEKIIEQCTQIPEGFAIHAKLKRIIESKRHPQAVDWSLAEQCAMGSLLLEGFSVRLSGQDSARGTFSQRHAVWIDQKTNTSYVPLAHLDKQQGLFEVYNSPLSEFGVLGFEYGYSLSSPKTLVIWEAQFGDFANGAQVIIDQYIAACAQKWLRYSGLVLLLPHGYEGQGAEHSSARLERYLQLCAQNNMQVCYPTTPAQYFHMLRRQMKRLIRLPLIGMMPKELLRHPRCLSSIQDLITGGFQEIIQEDKPEAKEILCCTGRIYYDLLEEREKRKKDQVAIVRLEQLYPLSSERLKDCIDGYSQATRCCWVQEEPENMGAGNYILPILQNIWGKEVVMVARAASAAVATGSHAMHEREYHILMDRIFV